MRRVEIRNAGCARSAPHSSAYAALSGWSFWLMQSFPLAGRGGWMDGKGKVVYVDGNGSRLLLGANNIKDAVVVIPFYGCWL